MVDRDGGHGDQGGGREGEVDRIEPLRGDGHAAERARGPDREEPPHDETTADHPRGLADRAPDDLHRIGAERKPKGKLSAAGGDIVRHRDMYQKLFATMIGYLNMGLGPEDAVERNPLREYQPEFGDPSAFTYGALRSMLIAYVPD